MTVWHDGEYAPPARRIDVRDRGFLLGDGVFETLLVIDGTPIFLKPHLDRLKTGLSVLGIRAPAGLAQIRTIIRRLTLGDGLAKGCASARITVTRGVGPRGLAPPVKEAPPTMTVSVASVPPATDEPLRLAVTARCRFAGAAGSSFKAIGGYLENILAVQDARQAGADDAILVNEQGRIVSASAANLFLIDPSGAVSTPPPAEGAMPGVVRGALLRGAREHRVEMRERPLTPGDLASGALFLTNSLRGIAPARLIKGARASPPGALAALTRLQSWYQEEIGREQKQERGAS